MRDRTAISPMPDSRPGRHATSTFFSTDLMRLFVIAGMACLSACTPQRDAAVIATKGDTTSAASGQSVSVPVSRPDSGLLASEHHEVFVARWFNKRPWPSGAYDPYTETQWQFDPSGTVTRAVVHLPEGEETTREVIAAHFTSSEGFWSARGTRDSGLICIVFPGEPKTCDHYRVARIFDRSVESPTWRRVVTVGHAKWKESKAN